MRGVHILCFIMALPILAALGHDIYLSLNGKDLYELDLTNPPFKFSDVGWIWTTYSRDTYDLMHDGIDQATWKTWIAPVLEQRSVIVAAIPAAFVYALLIVMKIFGWGPFRGTGALTERRKKVFAGKGAKGDYAIDKGKAAHRVKYKRK